MDTPIADHYRHKIMKGKPITAGQKHLLRQLGYCGEDPADRAHAARLIEQLLQERRKDLR